MNPIHERIRQLRTRDPIAATLGPDNATVATLRGRLTDPIPADELKRAPFDQIMPLNCVGSETADLINAEPAGE